MSVVLFLHGVAGGWDELAIAVAALAVLWIAVKLAGRKGGQDDDEEEALPDELAARSVQEEQQGPAHTPTKLG